MVNEKFKQIWRIFIFFNFSVTVSPNGKHLRLQSFSDYNDLVAGF